MTVGQSMINLFRFETKRVNLYDDTNGKTIFICWEIIKYRNKNIIISDDHPNLHDQGIIKSSFYTVIIISHFYALCCIFNTLKIGEHFLRLLNIFFFALSWHHNVISTKASLFFYYTIHMS